jgi:hypothetical protein
VSIFSAIDVGAWMVSLVFRSAVVSKAGAECRREEHSGLKKVTGAVPRVPMAREAMDEVL